MIKQNIVPSLVFKKDAESAVKLYVDLFSQAFGNSKILAVTRFTEVEIAALERLPEELRPGKAGDVCNIRFLLNGQELCATNGGAYFDFSAGMSLYVKCRTQEQIDLLYEGLSEGGEQQDCGWVKDRFGMSWQIAPDFVWEMIESADRAKAERVLAAVFKMKKYDIATLKNAYEGYTVSRGFLEAFLANIIGSLGKMFF